ncbi:MAG: lipopolysaccharide transporter permease [Acidobacteria bacterium]|nr:lipopolysaccharide transporter permease [Acidobacteriota bacterium]
MSLKILDRYLVRAIVPPMLLALLALTFVLMMPPILLNAEKLIAKGVSWSIIVRVLMTLVPQALGVTIPMALLYGILFGLGRLSADREFVALQACGVSVFRVFRPIALLAVVACGATAYDMIVALPDANQTFRQITYDIVASGAQSDIKPRVFFTSFPNRVLYVRDIQPATGWQDVFLADATQPEHTTVFVAKSGRLLLDREKRTVELVLENGTQHTTSRDRPDEYDANAFESTVIKVDPETIFPRTQIVKGDNEKTIAELRQTIAENTARHAASSNQLYTIQQKFSLPVACLVLALIGVALGASNSKDGKLASFALGTGVVFIYYIILYSARAGAFAGRLPASFAPWLVNLILGAAGIALVIWRAGSADQPIRFSIPRFWRGAAPTAATGARAARVVIVVRIPHVDWPRPRLLDLYVVRQYLSIFLLSFGALVGIFYISTLIDLADKLFGGVAPLRLLLRYFYFATPQFVYYIIPLSALVSTLVTIGLLTKNSELIVMRACGISLYRSALPLLLFALLFSGALYGLQEQVLAESNREAARLNGIIRGYPMQTFGVFDRRWIIGRNGDIYHYDFFDPRANQFSRLSMFHLNEATWKLDSLIYAKEAGLIKAGGREGQAPTTWTARAGWTREFSTAKPTRRRAERPVVKYAPFEQRAISLEPPAYFKTDEPEADRMTYGELKQYIAKLQASGYHVVPYVVQLQRKVAFPFVTLIMTLLAVPFAVTTGRSGAIYGVGAGIVLALIYWTTLSIFGALGAGGWMSPVLAAWAPNILFGAAAAYLLLTVRT